jgi:hypothetical protein
LRIPFHTGDGQSCGRQKNETRTEKNHYENMNISASNEAFGGIEAFTNSAAIMTIARWSWRGTNRYVEPGLFDLDYAVGRQRLIPSPLPPTTA